MNNCKINYIENSYRETSPQLADRLTEVFHAIWKDIKDSELFRPYGDVHLLSKAKTKKRIKQEEFLQKINAKYNTTNNRPLVSAKLTSTGLNEKVVVNIHPIAQQESIDLGIVVAEAVIIPKVNPSFDTKEYLDDEGNSNTNVMYSLSSNSTIKPGVEELFESNPELTNIGTAEQYSQYLDTIFPDSKVKDIVYHDGGHGKIKEEGFRKDLIGISDGGVLGNGFYFYFDRTKKYAEQRSHTESVLLNVKNVSTKTEILKLANLENGLGQYEKALSKLSGITVDTKIKGVHGKYIGNYAEALTKIGVDGVKGKYGTGEEIVVFEPKQIHTLSSKKDLEMFKNFINFTKSEYAKYGDIQQFRDYIISKNFAAVEEFLVINNKIDRKC